MRERSLEQGASRRAGVGLVRTAALFNILLSAFEAGDLGKHNRREGEGEAQEQLRDEKRAELTIVGRRLNGAGSLVTDFPTDHIDFIQVFGAKLAQRQGQIRK